MSFTRVFSSLSEYFYEARHPMLMKRSKSTPEVHSSYYILYRDGEKVFGSEHMDLVLNEMDNQISILQTNYLPPENILTVEQFDDGVRILTRNANYIPSYDSILAEFVIRTGQPPVIA